MRALLLSIMAAAMVSPAFGQEALSSKPNVLFVVVDDLKPLLGCYGATCIKSPNIDRLAASGTLFTSSYCQVSFCAPSRMSVLTGLRPDTTRVVFNPPQQQDILRTRFPDLVTLPQHFKNHGYITHPIHKVFDGRTVDAGHDRASWSVPYGPWEMASGEKPAPGGYQDPATKARLAEAVRQGQPASGPATEGCDIPDNAYHDGGVAFTAAKRIREFRQQGRPFLRLSSGSSACASACGKWPRPIMPSRITRSTWLRPMRKAPQWNLPRPRMLLANPVRRKPPSRMPAGRLRAKRPKLETRIRNAVKCGQSRTFHFLYAVDGGFGAQINVLLA